MEMTQNTLSFDPAFSKLTEAEKRQVTNIMNNIELKNSQEILSYGSSPQANLSEYAGAALDNIRTRDIGYIGEMLTELMIKVKQVDIENINTNNRFISNLPVIGSMINSAKRFTASYEKLSPKIDNIVDELDKSRLQLMRNIKVLENYYEKNITYINELCIYILAGSYKLDEFKQKLLPELQAKTQASEDPICIQELKDMENKILRFERKLDELRRTKMIAIQNIPQIRLIQNSNEELIEKIQSSIINTIPLWKNQIIIAISLLRQKKSLELQRTLSETSNNLIRKNSEMLKQVTLDVTKENERSIIDMDTLKKVNSDLISTIEEILKLQTEGRMKRLEAEKDIAQLESELRTTLSSISSKNK